MGVVAVSQDTLEQRAEALLSEWGACQHKEQSPLQQAINPIASMMQNYGRRSRQDKSRQWAYQRTRRRIKVGEKSVPIRPMYPDRADKQSDGGKKTPQRWPEHIERVDRVLAQLPDSLLRALTSYYVYGHSIRGGAESLHIDPNEYRRRLERGRWFLVGHFQAVDA